MLTVLAVLAAAAGAQGLLLTTRAMRHDQDAGLAFPMEALFKASNHSRPAGGLGRGMPADDIKDEDIFTAVMTEPPDTELFPDDGSRYGEYSPCAVALIRALPSGPRGRAAVLATLASALFSVRSALRKPMTVVVQGLFVAKRVVTTEQRRRADANAADALAASPYDWASIFDNLEVSSNKL